MRARTAVACALWTASLLGVAVADPAWTVPPWAPPPFKAPITSALVFSPTAESSAFGQPRPCMKDFAPLRQDAEEKAGLIRAATARKAPREEICKLIADFATSEAKMLQFLETMSVSCGIPRQLTTQMKASHERTARARTQVCSAAPASQPAAPSLSDVLGTATSPIPETPRWRMADEPAW